VKNISAVIGSMLLLSSIPAIAAWDEECDHEKSIDLNLDLSDTETLAVIAGAGKLTITGESGISEARITGRACASSEEWLDESSVEARSGEQAKITVALPDTDGTWSFLKDSYAFIDLEVIVPDDLELDVVDSSGSMRIDDVGTLSINDSSGSITIENSGPLRLKDSSGSMKFTGVNGDVTILSDSSGSISGYDIDGSVLVKQDSSGSMKFEDVTGDVVIERDSSGGIVVARVGGDFRVLKDGSGGIRSSEVRGEVSIPLD
jgi:hypothetical protein